MVPNRKNIIITCDDFGMHESINRAALKTYQNNMLDQVSLVSNGLAFDDAIETLKKMPDVRVGFHFNIIEGFPVARKEYVSTLLNSEGLFLNSVKRFVVNCIINGLNINHIRNEFEAQILKIKDAKINISYLDSHRHLHLYPPIANILKELIKEYSIKKVRNVTVPFFALKTDPAKLFSLLLFYISNNKYGADKFIADRFLGYFQNGRVNIKDINYWFNHINSKNKYEISLHLGENNKVIEEKLKWVNIGYYADWEGEFKAINSTILKKNNNRFKLVQAAYWPLLLSPVFFVRTIQRTRMKLFSNTIIDSDIDLPSSWINNILKTICRWDIKLQDRPFGSSLFSVLKKKHQGEEVCSSRE